MKMHHMGRGRGGGHGRRYAGDIGHVRRGGGFGITRSERVLDKAELQVLLLSLLSDGTKHGYELIRAIKALSEGCYAPSPGMVYPALNAMAEEGLATPSAEEAGRKSFGLTEAGRQRLTEKNDELSAIVERLKSLPDSQAQTRAPIARALANLDLVLANVPAAASDEQVDQIVTLIDGVARQIERIA